MLNIQEIKARTEAFFKEKGVPNPKLDTDLLIAHSLEMKRLELYLEMDRPLTEAQLSKLRPLVKRRANREPLQYILGSTQFCGLNLKVDARALIPRYETEELVELITEKIDTSPKRILDLGTGSGALALALASQYPEAEVTAIDLSSAALELAKENALALGLDERVQFLEGSWWAPLKEGARFDLIVSNPPYLTEAEMKTAEPEVIGHEPHSALVSGPDGMEDFKILLKEAVAYLEPDGLLAFETGIAQGVALTELANNNSLLGESVEDLSGRPRFFFCRAR